MQTTIQAIIIIVAVLVAYLIPSILAVQDKKRNKTAIIALNILTGWTLVGWIVSLVWALTKEKD
jgi:hypothetical protein